MTYRYKHQKGGEFMALRSQLITKEFPELDRVERLNNEAFPEEERIPLSDFLKLDGRDDYHFFAFYDEDDFVGFASVLYNAKVFYVRDVGKVRQPSNSLSQAIASYRARKLL